MVTVIPSLLKDNIPRDDTKRPTNRRRSRRCVFTVIVEVGGVNTVGFFQRPETFDKGHPVLEGLNLCNHILFF